MFGTHRQRIILPLTTLGTLIEPYSLRPALYVRLACDESGFWTKAASSLDDAHGAYKPFTLTPYTQDNILVTSVVLFISTPSN
jgi:hypothetical protein